LNAYYNAVHPRDLPTRSGKSASRWLYCSRPRSAGTCAALQPLTGAPASAVGSSVVQAVHQGAPEAVQLPHQQAFEFPCLASLIERARPGRRGALSDRRSLMTEADGNANVTHRYIDMTGTPAFPGSYAVAASFSYGLAPVAYRRDIRAKASVAESIHPGRLCSDSTRGDDRKSPKHYHQSLLNATFRHYFALSTERCYDLKRKAGSCTRNPLSPNSRLCITALLSITDSGRFGTCASSNTPRPGRRDNNPEVACGGRLEHAPFGRRNRAGLPCRCLGSKRVLRLSSAMLERYNQKPPAPSLARAPFLDTAPMVNL
jgi:hypothetical protein